MGVGELQASRSNHVFHVHTHAYTPALSPQPEELHIPGLDLIFRAWGTLKCMPRSTGVSRELCVQNAVQ